MSRLTRIGVDEEDEDEDEEELAEPHASPPAAPPAIALFRLLEKKPLEPEEEFDGRFGDENELFGDVNELLDDEKELLDEEEELLPPNDDFASTIVGIDNATATHNSTAQENNFFISFHLLITNKEITLYTNFYLNQQGNKKRPLRAFFI